MKLEFKPEDFKYIADCTVATYYAKEFAGEIAEIANKRLQEMLKGSLVVFRCDVADGWRDKCGIDVLRENLPELVITESALLVNIEELEVVKPKAGCK
jgi:hypothetical protein